MIELLISSLAVGVLVGVVLVSRGGPENSLIGLNIATICAITAFLAVQREQNILFTGDILFYLILPGVFGVIVFTRFMSEVRD
ncbi:MAG: hypothetical protein GF416_02010 [Candidatus Altiarchaeales archaeon]|nr:hypothetical protein [Candidatus Altiarchaeales archaeon]MBD3415892.1 hypothetical protein [Candidatus Altiarchaeales archaeon]